MGKILIIGDIMLDVYISGIISRISPEAPVPVLLENEDSYRYVPGGAANVAMNLAVTGSEVHLFSIIGTEESGNRLCELLEHENINTELLIKSEYYLTTTKKRFIGQNHQQILRVDKEKIIEVPDSLYIEKKIILEEKIQSYDVILLSDYKKGFLTDSFCEYIINLANKYQIPVLVDVKDLDYKKYAKATLLKPNRSELKQLTGLKVETLQDAIQAAVSLCNRAEVEYVLATLGEEGMILVNADGLIQYNKAVAKEIYDVTGAGDTSIAYLAAEWAKGTSIVEAMEIANIAAGIQVSKVGTSVVLPYEVELVRFPNRSYFGAKKMDTYKENELLQLTDIKMKGKKIVFTNGCFDILHSGHITYLKAARELGDCLVVGVNSDDSVKRLKGKERPINHLVDRLMLLSALECVDFVIPFEEDTPLELIKKIRPDVLVKGGDYEISEIAGADVVFSYGGIVTTIPYVEGKSTTNLIRSLA